MENDYFWGVWEVQRREGQMGGDSDESGRPRVGDRWGVS